MASSKKTQRFIKPKIHHPQIDVSYPNHFRCPISLDLMSDPVTVSTGITYDRCSIETWLETGCPTCPVTNQELPADEYLIPNHSLRRMIQDWCRSTGIDRIPTPKIPVTSAQASEILSDIASFRCRELVAKVRSLVKESERNRRCFLAAGAGKVFAVLFGGLASDTNSTDEVTEEILSVIACMLPLDEDSCRHVGSAESMNRLVPMIRSENLAAVLVTREVLSKGKQFVRNAIKTNGLVEAVMELIRKPVSPRVTKAALTVVFFLIQSDDRTASKFVELGLVNLVLEILIESEKGICEKALMVFDEICGIAEGREEAFGHALTVPVLAKKMFRVSEAATESVVSALWKICKSWRGILEEATQVGVFQKVLLLLQVGCSWETKEKATELLKLMNEYRGKLECIDVMDFKGLKKAF